MTTASLDFADVVRHAREHWGVELRRALSKHAKYQFVVSGVFPGFSHRKVRRYVTLEEAARALDYPVQ